MCGDDCEHFRKSEMICDDHEAHMTRVLSFERRPWKDAFHEELERKGSVYSVQFTTQKHMDGCEYEGVCSLIFVKLISNFDRSIEWVVCKDLKGNTYMHDVLCVIAYSSWIE